MTMVKPDQRVVHEIVTMCCWRRPACLEGRNKNTVALDEIAVSENLLPEVKNNSFLQPLGEPYRLSFNNQGNLLYCSGE